MTTGNLSGPSNSLEEWVCNSNEAVHLMWVQDPSVLETDENNREETLKEHEHPPYFTYPFFGEDEKIFGYKDLRIKVYYAAGSLYAYLGQSYSAIIDDVPSCSLHAQSCLSKIQEKMSSAFTTNYEAFVSKAKRDYKEFRPMGEKIHEYVLPKEKDSGVDDVVYEIYRCKFDTPRYREYHTRLRHFLLYYIEGASFIDEHDPRWEVALLYVASMPTIQSLAASTSLHLFYFALELRMRISQFLIFPPYMNKGHGGTLYRSLYDHFMSREDVAELTVEDPNDHFQDLRDRNDMRYLLSHNAFSFPKSGASSSGNKDSFIVAKPPLDAKSLQAFQRAFKLSKRQAERCCEMAMLKGLKANNEEEYKAYRLQVKRRIYRQNEETLESFEPEERLAKLDETYRLLEEDYRRILNSL
ncbi:histone acetyltransferase 1 [Quaeritorhiza haematococci]|nr:histone acetyltransferase 1 [Quaeritorhiza haematococci]